MIKHLSEGLSLRRPLASILREPRGADQRCEKLSILGSSIIQFRDLISAFLTTMCFPITQKRRRERLGNNLSWYQRDPSGILLCLLSGFLKVDQQTEFAFSVNCSIGENNGK